MTPPWRGGRTTHPETDAQPPSEADVQPPQRRTHNPLRGGRTTPSEADAQPPQRRTHNPLRGGRTTPQRRDAQPPRSRRTTPQEQTHTPPGADAQPPQGAAHNPHDPAEQLTSCFGRIQKKRRRSAPSRPPLEVSFYFFFNTPCFRQKSAQSNTATTRRGAQLRQQRRNFPSGRLPPRCFFAPAQQRHPAEPGSGRYKAGVRDLDAPGPLVDNSGDPGFRVLGVVLATPWALAAILAPQQPIFAAKKRDTRLLRDP